MPALLRACFVRPERLQIGFGRIEKNAGPLEIGAGQRFIRWGWLGQTQCRNFTYPNPARFPIFLRCNANYAGRSLITGI